MATNLIFTNTYTTITANLSGDVWIVGPNVFVATDSNVAIDGSGGVNGNRTFLIYGNLIAEDNIGIFLSASNSLASADNITIYAGALVYADNHSIQSDSTAGARIVNHGNIVSGYGRGIQTSSASSIIVNNGTITALSNWGIRSGGDISNNGLIDADIGIVLQLNSGSVANNGAITARSTGMNISGSHDSVANHGSINSQDIGIVISSGSNAITNSGSITAVTNGLYIENSSGEQTEFVNSGIVSGLNVIDVNSASNGAERIINTQTGLLHGNIFLGAGNDTLTNAGQISGNVNMGDGTNFLANSGTIAGDVYGGVHSDTFDLRGGWVSGTVYGGNGNDTYIIDRADLNLNESFATGNDTVQSSVSHRLALDFENLFLTGIGNIEGYGNLDGNTIFGNAGHNLLDGLDGNDTIYGGFGNDSIFGGAGNDALYGEDGHDLIEDGDGDDFVLGATGNDTFIAGLGDDLISGDAGIDTYDAINATGDTTFNFANGTGALGNDVVFGIERYFGGNFADLVTGTSGNDHIVARNGDDTVQGGDGNDYTDGGDGVDTVSYSTASAAVRVTLGLASVQNTLGAGFDTVLNFEHITGSNFNDTLRGSSADNLINGGNGNDFLIASTGADTITAGTGTLDTYDAFWATGALYFDFVSMSGAMGDHVISGVERFYASNFNDTIAGSAVNDIVAGRFGNDNISPGAGNDFIDGGGGNDTLTGGAGNDSFQFLTAGFLPGDADLITDFGTTAGSNDDILRLQGSAANYGFANIAGGVRVTHTASGATIDVMNAGLTAAALSAETVYF